MNQKKRDTLWVKADKLFALKWIAVAMAGLNVLFAWRRNQKIRRLRLHQEQLKRDFYSLKEKSCGGGWVKADKEPSKEDYPILAITREGAMTTYRHAFPARWSSVVDLHGVVYWLSVPLPRDVFGEAVKKGYTLT